jgi:hypothetical protein
MGDGAHQSGGKQFFFRFRKPEGEEILCPHPVSKNVLANTPNPLNILKIADTTNSICQILSQNTEGHFS